MRETRHRFHEGLVELEQHGTGGLDLVGQTGCFGPAAGCVSLACPRGSRPDCPELLSFLSELPLARRRCSFARDAHREQRRGSDAARFIVHPVEVAVLLLNTGYAEHLVAACVLHDATEDTATTVPGIRARFGPKITEIAAAIGCGARSL